METRSVKARSAAIAKPLKRETNLARPWIESVAPAKKVTVYRSLSLRPDEWLDIVAKGRRRA